MERIKIVLANTIQLADHDGRYYPSTKVDTAKIHIPGTDNEDYFKEIRRHYAVNCLPVMVNSAFRELQRMEREQIQTKTKEPAAVESFQSICFVKTAGKAKTSIRKQNKSCED